MFSRRAFLAWSWGAIWAPTSSWRVPIRRGIGDHPTPRPGIDASRVLKDIEIKGGKDVSVAFNEVRQIPQVVDGIRCYCGCAERPGFYSLLTCFEGPDAMALMCDLCQGHGRYAFRLHCAGKTLDEIRAAIDDRYAP